MSGQRSVIHTRRGKWIAAASVLVVAGLPAIVFSQDTTHPPGHAAGGAEQPAPTYQELTQEVAALHEDVAKLVRALGSPRSGSGPAAVSRTSMGAGMAGMQTMPPLQGYGSDGAALSGAGNRQLTQRLAALREKAAKLERTLGSRGGGSGMAPMGGGMAGMSGSASPAPPMAGMSGSAAPASPAMNMMGMMDKMMGMMDKMMGMGGGAMPAGAPMAGGGMGMMDMDDDAMEMGAMGGGAMPAGAPAAGMSGGGMGMGMGKGMGMDQMEMAGMMGMGAMGNAAPGAMSPSAMPGFPGASHLYHIGASGFFLDHPQHIALTTQQQAGLNTAKEQALLAKSTADRAIEQAEQELWMLTAADQPDAAKIEAQLTAIGKLTGDQRLAFIRAVGEASRLLTDEQRKSLTGFAPPAPANPMATPGAAMPPMKDM